MKNDKMITGISTIKNTKDKIALQQELDDYIIELNQAGLLVNADDIPRVTRAWKRNHSTGRKKKPSSPKTSNRKFDVPYPPKTPVDSLPIDWEGRIGALELYFSATVLPADSVQLNPCTTINDVSGFLDGHLTLVKTCNRNRVYLPYLERLETLMEILKKRSL